MARQYHFWLNIPSHLQAGHIRALATLADVKLAIDAWLSVHRAGMGWRFPDHSGVQIHEAGDTADVQRVLAAQKQETVNVIGGLRGRTATAVLDWCLPRRRPVCVLAESGRHDDWGCLEGACAMPGLLAGCGVSASLCWPWGD